MRALLLAALVLALAAPGRAAFDDVGTSARVTGMGGAFTAVADDVNSIYYNPAGLGQLSRPEFTTTYSKLLGGLTDNSNLQNSFFAYEHPLPGSWGTAGVAWNYFTLDSLYRESSVFASYGAPLFADALPGSLYGGVNVKYLSRTLSAGSAASQPLDNNGQVVPGAMDPVLQHGTESTPDFDAGLLYRFADRWSAGVDIQHLLEPNIAFDPSATDALGRNYKFGLAYRTPFTTLSSDFQITEAPDGTQDETGIVAAEKWLPTLLYGTFGVRGALAAGTRNFRDISMGLSYKIYKLEFDYGFDIPVSGIMGTVGTHRIGLTWRFGKNPAVDSSVSEAILENIETLAEVGTPQFDYELKDLALYKRQAVQELLRAAQLDLAAGQFAKASGMMDQVMALKPADPKIGQTQGRVAMVASAYPEVRDFSADPAQAAIYDGLLKYVSGMNEAAIKDLSYARSLVPADQRLDTLLRALGATGPFENPPAPAPAPAAASPAAAVATAPAAAPAVAASTAPAAVAAAAPETSQQAARKVVEGTMALLEVAMTQRDFEKVIQLARRVLELDAANAPAYRRMGVAYYELHKYREAYKALRSSYRLEMDPKTKASTKTFAEAVARLLKARAVVVRRPAAAAPACSVRLQDVEKVYDAGVELYAEGKLSESAQSFKDILCADPGNAPARRALKRVEAELYEAGEQR